MSLLLILGGIVALSAALALAWGWSLTHRPRLAADDHRTQILRQDAHWIVRCTCGYTSPAFDERPAAHLDEWHHLTLPRPTAARSA